MLVSNRIIHTSTLRSISISYQHVFNSSRISTTGTRLKSTLGSLYENPILSHEWIIDGKVFSSADITLLQGKRTVLFLHGLLGNNKNLRSPAKRLTEDNPDIMALLLDLRGHGGSSTKSILSTQAHVNPTTQQSLYTPPHTISACTTDIIRTLQHLGLTGSQNSPVGVIGHSFGGRCALSYLHHMKFNKNEKDPVYPPTHTWLLDVVPGTAHSSVSNVIQAISSVNMPISSKKDLVSILVNEKNISLDIANWMTTNLHQVQTVANELNNKKKGFDFIFDLNIIQDILSDFEKQPFMEIIRECCFSDGYNRQQEQKIYSVMAGKNEAWTKDIIEELQNISIESKNQSNHSGKLELITLPNAGHWVHVDDLDGLMNAINNHRM